MVSAATESALNRPVWSALTTGDRRFAQGGPLALRFPPDIAPFGATADDLPEAFAALKELFPAEAARRFGEPRHAQALSRPRSRAGSADHPDDR